MTSSSLKIYLTPCKSVEFPVVHLIDVTTETIKSLHYIYNKVLVMLKCYSKVKKSQDNDDILLQFKTYVIL